MPRLHHCQTVRLSAPLAQLKPVRESAEFPPSRSADSRSQRLHSTFRATRGFAVRAEDALRSSSRSRLTRRNPRLIEANTFRDSAVSRGDLLESVRLEGTIGFLSGRGAWGTRQNSDKFNWNVSLQSAYCGSRYAVCKVRSNDNWASHQVYNLLGHS